MNRLPHLVLGLVAGLALAGCATWQPPRGVDTAVLRGQALTETARGVRVGAVLLDADESHAMFGPGIEQAHVQPVWLEIENQTSQPLWLLRTGVDPDYFSPLEVAWAMHRPLSGNANTRIDAHVTSVAFANPIAPGTTNAGVIFTNPQRGTVLLNLDLLGNKTLVSFSLFLWRNKQGAEASAPWAFEYSEESITEYRDEAAFRRALEQLPCCAMSAEGTRPGDPLNMVFVGTLADIAAGLVRRNYRRDVLEYDVAHRVYGRAPGSVWRKRTQSGAPATWIRLWAAPMRFEGKRVFVAQVGRPVGGRFASHDANDAILHEDVDEARNLLVQEMMYSGGLEMLGFVRGANDAHYQTDGLRAVLFFATRPRSLSDVDFLDWEPFLERRDD